MNRIRYHGSMMLCRIVWTVFPLRIWPHIVAHLGLAPHCADFRQYVEMRRALTEAGDRG